MTTNPLTFALRLTWALLVLITVPLVLGSTALLFGFALAPLGTVVFLVRRLAKRGFRAIDRLALAAIAAGPMWVAMLPLREAVLADSLLTLGASTAVCIIYAGILGATLPKVGHLGALPVKRTVATWLLIAIHPGRALRRAIRRINSRMA